MDDVGEASQVQKRKTRVQLERERQLEEIRKLLTDKGARYFLWRLLTFARVFQSMSNPNAIEMAINSGKRDTGNFIFAEILEANPEIFSIMRDEALAREKELNG